MTEYKRPPRFVDFRDLEVPVDVQDYTVFVTVPEAVCRHIASGYPREEHVRMLDRAALLLARFGEEAGAEMIWRRIEADPLYLSRIPQELIDRLPNDSAAVEEFRAQFG